MKWSDKIKWFTKREPEYDLPDLDWTHEYINAKGNPVKCVIIKEHKDNTIDLLNENNVGLNRWKMSDVEEIAKHK